MEAAPALAGLIDLAKTVQKIITETVMELFEIAGSMGSLAAGCQIRRCRRRLDAPRCGPITPADPCRPG